MTSNHKSRVGGRLFWDILGTVIAGEKATERKNKYIRNIMYKLPRVRLRIDTTLGLHRNALLTTHSHILHKNLAQRNKNDILFKLSALFQKHS